MNNPMRNLAAVITEKFISADPSGAAKALETLATHEIILLIGSLKARTLVACINPMQPAKAAAVLRRLPLKQSSYVLSHVEVVQAAKLWKEFSTPYQERLRTVLEKSFVELLTKTDQYGPDSVARFMNTDIVSVRTEVPLGVLIERLKNLPRKKLPLVCFIVGKNGELKGGIRTAEISFYGRDTLCGSVMLPLKSLELTDAVETALKLFSLEEVDIAPVVNEKNILMGFVEKYCLAPMKKPSLWKRLTD